MTDERIEMLLQKYKEYEVSDEGYAVLRVKQNMKEAQWKLSSIKGALNYDIYYEK